MRPTSRTCLLGAVAALAFSLHSPQASACEAWGGNGCPRAHRGAPVYVRSQALDVHAAPPVYAYSYFSPANGTGAFAFGPTYVDTYYAARINIFRGPRWDYSAAYYTSPTVSYGRGFRPAGVYRAYRPYRAYLTGPIIRAGRRW